MSMPEHILDLIQASTDQQRLVETATRLIQVPSPTLSAGVALDTLAEILTEAQFEVSRPEADWPVAPAVVAWLRSGQPGPTLQFDCHLDTVHLPFSPPRVENGVLYGSGASDMKGGTAAAVEAMRVLAEQQLLQQGSVLLTCHDHHEGPWGDKRQVIALCREGIHGDGVLLPEYQAAWLPTAGRGMAIFRIDISRSESPRHEIHTSPEIPNVIDAGLDLVSRLKALSFPEKPADIQDSGEESLFVGMVQTGEIYNQSPQTCHIEGTRRWLQHGGGDEARQQIRLTLEKVDKIHGTESKLDWEVQGDTFTLALDHPLVEAFQSTYAAFHGAPLPNGPKLFIDDGNIYAAEVGIPALTHGPDAVGAHTTNENVPIRELERVARQYAATAWSFCQLDPNS